MPTEPGAGAEAGTAGAACSADRPTGIVWLSFRKIRLRRERGGGGAVASVVENGVSVQGLREAREALGGGAEGAQFTVDASAKWEEGVHSTTTIKNFFGLGGEQTHKSETVFDADHPEVFAASDNGITPIEYLLVGLAGCLTAGVASVAQNRGIQLRSVESTVE